MLSLIIITIYLLCFITFIGSAQNSINRFDSISNNYPTNNLFSNDGWNFPDLNEFMDEVSYKTC